MNKYQEKLESIKSRRIGFLQRFQYGGYSISVLLISFFMIIFGYRGLFELLESMPINQNNWFSYSLNILFIALGLFLLFVIFKLIGLALRNLTICLSGLKEHSNHIKTESHFYWKLFSVAYLTGILIVAWDARDAAIVLLIPLNGLMIFLGLIGLTYNVNFFNKIIWKIVFYFQFLIIAVLLGLYFYSDISFFNIEPLLDMSRIIMIVFILIFFMLIPIYGLWKYIYKAN